MAYEIIIHPRAESDLAAALLYLSERAPEAAAKWYQRVVAEMESLAEMPARCPIAPETSKLGIELRHLVHGDRPGIYRIVFRIVEEAGEVHVLTVRHGARKPLTEQDLQPFLELP